MMDQEATPRPLKMTMPRTYPGPPISLDASGGDWIKRGHWDLPATNVAELPPGLTLAG
jgi:hypothetical protein